MKRTIVLVGPIPPPIGGIPKYVYDLKNSEFLNNRYELYLFNTAVPEKVRRYEKSNDRSYSSFLSDGFYSAFKLIKYAISNFYSFRKMLKHKKPEVIQVFTNSFWGFWRSFIFILIAKYYNVRVIFSLLNAIDVFWGESSFFGKIFIKIALNKSDFLLVQSRGLKKFVCNISTTPVVAIYNGVDLKDFNEPPNQNKFEKNIPKQIVFLGALTKNKGIYDIIDSLSEFNEFNCRFVFIGHGDVNKFENIIRKNNIKNNVVFKGSISDDEKLSILKESDIFLLPSYAEGQPIAILEAICAGLPVVSTTVGSIPEIIEDGVNGFLILPGDKISLVEKIRLLTCNHDMCKNISLNNYNTGKKLYDIERLFIETSQIYDQV